MIKDRESERRMILRDAPLPGGVGPTQTHLYMNGSKLMGQQYNQPSVPVIDFSAIPATVPAGAIAPYVADVAPDGWGLCDGAAYDTYEYRLLHSRISDKFGGAAYQAGVSNMPNAGLTFNVPDFRGKTMLMADPQSGHAAAVGDAGGHNERAPLVEHNHAVNSSNSNTASSNSKILDLDNRTVGPVTLAQGEEMAELWSQVGPYTNLSATFGGVGGFQLVPITTYGQAGLSGTITTDDTGTAIPSNDTRNLPPYIAVQYIIRLV